MTVAGLSSLESMVLDVAQSSSRGHSLVQFCVENVASGFMACVVACRSSPQACEGIFHEVNARGILQS